MSKAASGQVGPKNPKGGKRIKRGRLHFTEEEVTRQTGAETSGQVGPKPQSTGKFKQDGEREKPSSRLRQEGEARRDTAHEEQAAQKDKKDKQEKKKERAEAKAEHSAVKLEMAKEKLAQQKPQKPPSLPKRAAMAAGAGVWAYGHRKIHEVEHENVGVESAHKAELLTEAGVHKATRYVKRRIREHPELQSNFLSRMAQKWKIKREYAKQAREAAKQTAKAAGAAATTTEKAAAYAAQFVRRHKGGAIIILLLFCLFLILNSVFSALPSLGTGMMNAVVGTSYTAEDEDILGANEDYTALENDLRQKIANIESTHPGYDEYRYDVDELGHNPYELTSYLIAKLRTYTRENVQGELRALFEAQYKLTLTEEVEIRYRTEMDTWTDEDGTTHTDTYEVPYEYYILHVQLQNKTLPVVVNSLLDAEQKEIYDITLELKGNKPYLWDDIYTGGGSYDPGSNYTIPGEALSDPAFAALIIEAEKYLGWPYVWGGSSPSTSFDCSGFVCWVYTASGVHNLPRTTATGIFNQCAYVSPADARPGDLIFFTRTYDCAGPVSHVGIYVGDGMMIHAGDPIKYASINTNYWQEHFYAFGRLN
jgi:peptidoglycan DL-endopeptidase CwlO